jgi:hypothetical protein
MMPNSGDEKKTNPSIEFAVFDAPKYTNPLLHGKLLSNIRYRGKMN